VALYIPEARRRRRVLLAALTGLVIGIAGGALGGRLSAPSVGDQVQSVRDDASSTTAGLRVISLHDQAGTGAGGTDLVLSRTKSELEAEFADAPWLSRTTRNRLLAQLAALRARTDQGTPAYGDAAEALAAAIDAAFAG